MPVTATTQVRISALRNYQVQSILMGIGRDDGCGCGCG